MSRPLSPISEGGEIMEFSNEEERKLLEDGWETDEIAEEMTDCNIAESPTAPHPKSPPTLVPRDPVPHCSTRPPSEPSSSPAKMETEAVTTAGKKKQRKFRPQRRERQQLRRLQQQQPTYQPERVLRRPHPPPLMQQQISPPRRQIPKSELFWTTNSYGERVIVCFKCRCAGHDHYHCPRYP